MTTMTRRARSDTAYPKPLHRRGRRAPASRCTRYARSTAATRASELLAAGNAIDARLAAERAITAEPASEPAYRLVTQTHLHTGEKVAARRALERCQHALADLGIDPEPATLELLRMTD